MRRYTRDKRYQRRNTFASLSEPSTGKKFPFKGVILMVLLGGFATVTAILFYFWNPAQPEKARHPLDYGVDKSVAGFDFITDKDNRNILHIHPPFVINLAGMEGRDVIRVSIWLETDTLDVADELNNHIPKFRRIVDDIITTIKQWKFVELNYGNGMQHLKDQLKNHINKYLIRGKVIKVLFPDVRFTKILPKAAPPEEDDQ